MTIISSETILDSYSNYTEKRITTLKLTYPRCIHAELLTHRTFSRNSASSRAIPTQKLIDDVKQNPFIPLYWGENKAGMQASEEINENVIHPVHGNLSNIDMWLKAKDNAIIMAEAFANAGYHKQIVNRILEPYSHIIVLVTSTEWDNFLELRDHKDAEPHIRLLAKKIKECLDNKKNQQILKKRQWHIPFIDEEEKFLKIEDKLKISVARCARISYMTFGGKKSSIEDDLKLYEKLVISKPLHASPTEHQAGVWSLPMFYGNFNGWIQYRKLLEKNEPIEYYI